MLNIINGIGSGLNAYAATLKRPEGGADFGALVGHMVEQARTTGAAAEAEGAKSIAGQGDLVSTAAAFNSAEVALETLVAARDRMVAAYNDIIRMQI